MMGARGLADQIAWLEHEQQETVLTRFTVEDAWWLGDWVRRTATARALRIVVDIRHGEHQLFHAALPGTCADHDSWAARKAATVRRFATASAVVGRRLRVQGKTLADYGLDPARYATAGGCAPVLVQGCGVVATLAVSGLPEDEDHALVVEALRALRDAG